MNRLHLVGVFPKLLARARPDHHRRHYVARACDEVVQPAQHSVRFEVQIHLFRHLAQRRLLGRFARIDPSAWQRPLTGMVAQLSRAAGQHQRRATLPFEMFIQPG